MCCPFIHLLNGYINLTRTNVKRIYAVVYSDLFETDLTTFLILGVTACLDTVVGWPGTEIGVVWLELEVRLEATSGERSTPVKASGYATDGRL